MDRDELKKYAEYLLEEHATDIEWLSIFEMAEGYGFEDFSDEDAEMVNELLSQARVTISWDD